MDGHKQCLGNDCEPRYVSHPPRTVSLDDANIDIDGQGHVSSRIPIGSFNGDSPLVNQHNDYPTGVTERALIGPAQIVRGSGYSPLMEEIISRNPHDRYAEERHRRD
jgi:hypothetical protein